MPARPDAGTRTKILAAQYAQHTVCTAPEPEAAGQVIRPAAFAVPALYLYLPRYDRNSAEGAG